MQAVAISYESMTYDEVMKLSSSERIAMLRVRARIKKQIDEEMKKK
ncbi:hypothetical protein [Alicyclobacillus acidoterrestris]|uniref:Uncharacterized protein n=1 Tax=Alicyclobacillus acidoterrestris (strain ATCC 49025 / DSM 3922 / CIP 106132 / NCIMB 13137 / GD3B) TaxID=1356854 RepID=A0A9E6ZRV8_ALIAG|nr:hypothetical protein [Alicyclobacillus acidoterrestris]UNO48049.1 hypothetical protein K1I37_15355 [Alicyclobacillus acidoterrestris]